MADAEPVYQTDALIAEDIEAYLDLHQNKGESIRVFPLSNWTELDIWQYIMKEGIEIVPLYMAAPRPTVEEVVAEMLLTTTSERQGRAIDKDAGSASMEKKKQEGYF